MDWTEVTITVNAKDVDKAGDIANMVVPYGIYIEDYSNLEEEAWEIAHIDLIDEDLLQKDRSKALVHIYISPEESPAEAVAFCESGIPPKELKTRSVWTPVWKRTGSTTGNSTSSPFPWVRSC